MTNEKIEEQIEHLFIKTEHQMSLISSITEIFSDFAFSDMNTINNLHNLLDILYEKITDSNSIAGSVLSDLATLNNELEVNEHG